MKKFITNSGAELIDEDECGVLYHVPMKYDPYNLVRVHNRIPEADGTFSSSYIAVPPKLKTVREGIAWSAGEGREGIQSSQLKVSEHELDELSLSSSDDLSSLLRSTRIESPCSVDWQAMSGDDRGQAVRQVRSGSN